MQGEPVDTKERDHGWIRAYLGGDPRGFERLFKSYLRPICHFLRRQGNLDGATAEDLAHDVMIRVYEGLPRFQFKNRFSTWLFAIALNRLKNHRQKSRPLAMADSVGAEGEGQIADDRQDPHREMSDRHLQVALDRAISRLPEKERTVFILKEYQGLTFQEISEILGQTLRNVQFIKDKANLRLQQDLEGLGLGEPGEVPHV